MVETRAIETTERNSCEYVDRVGDQWNVTHSGNQQSDQLRERRSVVERTVTIRFPSCSSMSCGASGRGGVLVIELITITYGKVYNGIKDDETHVDNLNLNPLFVLTHVNKLEVTGDCWWDVVVSPHACFRVLRGASGRFSCFLVHASWFVWLVS